MKKLVLPLAILVMLLLLGAAMAWDCVRYAADARHRVELADQEMQKQEARLVKLLTGFAKTPPEVQSAVAAYRGAESPHARHGAYEQLVVSFRKTMVSEIDPTNPLDRKFMDDIAGAINRREVSEKAYDDESAAYQHFLAGFRGSVAKLFSSRAQADGKPNP
jgi:hypothetical protein